MAAIIKAEVRQTGPTTSESLIRGHRTLIDRPVEKGGENRGPMGGELLLAALGGCFMSNLLAAILARGVQASGARVEVEGDLEGSPPAFVRIRLKASAECGDRETFAKLVELSERACIVANTLRSAVKLTVEVE
jgi:putative redox protein